MRGYTPPRTLCVLGVALSLLVFDHGWAAELNVGILRCRTRAGQSQTRVLSRLRDAIKANPEVHVWLAPEWLGASNRMRTAASFGRWQRALEAITMGSDALVIPGSIAWANSQRESRNTVPVVSNGRTLLAYSKMKDGGDSEFAARTGCRWVPGTRPGVVDWRGVKVGIEVCVDIGTLKDHGETVDLQAVPACELLPRSQFAAVRPGGAVLLCDGGFSHDGGFAVDPADMGMGKAFTMNGELVPVREGPAARTTDAFNAVFYRVPLPAGVTLRQGDLNSLVSTPR